MKSEREREREKERETVKEKEIGDFGLISCVQRYPFQYIYNFLFQQSCSAPFYVCICVWV